MITKGNDLIEARYRLTHNQQRLLLTLASQVQQDDEDFKDYTLRVDDIAKIWGITDTSFYTKIEDSVRDLLENSRGVIYLTDTKDKQEITRWISYAKYQKGSGTIEIRFDKSVKKYFLQLKDQFTQYHLSAVVQFRSTYSIRLYELLKMKQNMGRGGLFYRIFTVDEFRLIMGIKKDEYPNFNDLKKRVLDSAIKDIDELSDIRIVQTTCIKEGRSYAHIKITAEPRDQFLIDYDEKPKAQEGDTSKPRKMPKAYDELLAVGISDTTARNWLKKYGSKRVSRNLAYTIAMEQKSEIGNIGAYMAKIISKDIGGQLADLEERKAVLSSKKKSNEKKDDEQKSNGELAIKEIIKIFDSFNDDEKKFYLDELQNGLKGMEKVRFKTARESYIKANGHGIFSEFYLKIRQILDDGLLIN